MNQAHKRPYVVVFFLLAGVTVVELWVSSLEDITRTSRIAALMLLAAGKALLVVLYYMHLRYETTALRLLIVIPFVLALAFIFILTL